MVIHPREHDLAIGTFGRSFWILDDIRPLRAIAQKGAAEVLNTKVEAFPAPVAYLANIGESIGYRYGKIGDALYEGENRPYGSIISFYLSEANSDAKELSDQVKIEVKNGSGALVRTLYQQPTKGLNRINWELERDMPRFPQVKKPSKAQAPRGGALVPTGKYDVTVIYQGISSTTMVDVQPDPRLSISQALMAEKDAAFTEFYAMVEKATNAMDQIRSAQEKLTQLEELVEDENLELNTSISALQSDLKLLQEQCTGEKKQGLYRDPYTITGRLSSTGYMLKNPLIPLSQNHKLLMNQTKSAVDAFVGEVNEWSKTDYKKFQQNVKDAGISLFD
jgi:hypothetical protein